VRTREKLDGLVAELVSNYGDMYKACRSQAVSPMFVAQWRKDDAEVDEQLREAQRAGSMGLVSAAIDRATTGVEKGVYYQGECVATEFVPSDSLLSKLLEARVDEFSKRPDAAVNQFNGPTQINIMPRASSYEEWLGMRDATVGAKTLPAPITEAIDAEFTALEAPVRSPFEGLGI
jgi:hypothetical protein